MTGACENITVPQLLLRTVKKVNIGFNLLPPAAVVVEGNVFTGVCLSFCPRYFLGG